jgi:hypothetical protein
LKTKDIGLILKEPGFELKVSLCRYIFIKKMGNKIKPVEGIISKKAS